MEKILALVLVVYVVSTTGSMDERKNLLASEACQKYFSHTWDSQLDGYTYRQVAFGFGIEFDPNLFHNEVYLHATAAYPDNTKDGYKAFVYDFWKFDDRKAASKGWYSELSLEERPYLTVNFYVSNPIRYYMRYAQIAFKNDFADISDSPKYIRISYEFHPPEGSNNPILKVLHKVYPAGEDDVPINTNIGSFLWNINSRTFGPLLLPKYIRHNLAPVAESLQELKIGGLPVEYHGFSTSPPEPETYPSMYKAVLSCLYTDIDITKMYLDLFGVTRKE